MSPVTRTNRKGQVRVARYQAVQPMVVLWLTLLWLVLWRDVTPRLVVGGVLVSILVCLVFPLPPLRMHLRLRPIAFLWLVTKFAWDVLVASWQVSLVVLRRRPPLNAVIEVQLRTPSDFVLTVVGEMLSLVPGSIVVEARRDTYTLYLHVIDIPDEEAVQAYREIALAQERRVVRAFGVHLDLLDLPPDEAQELGRERIREEEGS